MIIKNQLLGEESCTRLWVYKLGTVTGLKECVSTDLLKIKTMFWLLKKE